MNPDTILRRKIKDSNAGADEACSGGATMEIGPIPGIRAIAVNRTPRADSDLSAAFDIDALSKMGNGAASARVNKAAGAEEDDDELLEEEETAGQEPEGVNYFA